MRYKKHLETTQWNQENNTWTKWNLTKKKKHKKEPSRNIGAEEFTEWNKKCNRGHQYNRPNKR